MAKQIQTTNNPFEFTQQDTAETQSRKLDFTPSLIAQSNARAIELMKSVSTNPELYDLANTALDGLKPQDLIDLINAVFNDETIQDDSKLLTGADDDQLSRLLESRRSDRSKAKAKNPRSSVAVCRTYISAMYAELLIRSIWNKPYQSADAGLNMSELAEDKEALTRKIKSLQSKKCRLGKTAPYVEADAAALEEVEAEIDRLNSLRPNTRVVSKTVIRDADTETIRQALSMIDLASLEDADREKYEALIAKLG